MEEKLLIQRENQILRIQLEATREAGIQASQKIHGNFQIREEELRKSWEKEKEKLQASNLQQEENLGKILENSKFLEESMREKQLRIQRMEEEKQTLIQRKISLEKQLPMLRNEGLPQFQREIPEFQREVPELQDRIQHLQRLIQDQHRGLRNLIQEREELNSKLRIQEEKIQDLSEKLEALEFQNSMEYWNYWIIPVALQEKKAGKMKAFWDSKHLPGKRNRGNSMAKNSMGKFLGSTTIKGIKNLPEFPKIFRNSQKTCPEFPKNYLDLPVGMSGRSGCEFMFFSLGKWK